MGYGLTVITGYERASLGRRLVALSLDWAVATFTTGLIFPIFASSLAPSLTRLVIFVIEVSVLTALTGASIGQRIMGIRVVSYPDQFFIIPSKAFLRTVFIALVIPALVIDSEGRGLHDSFTKSQVVKVR
ncbi:MAG: hypothetical protein RLZZ12_269 [Actinomycetota bacterium]|jgi:uncharacterized RDD family membrane protein YckC